MRLLILMIVFGAMPLAQCEVFSAMILADTTSAYQQLTDELATTMFPTDQFDVVCESTQLPSDPAYAL